MRYQPSSSVMFLAVTISLAMVVGAILQRNSIEAAVVETAAKPIPQTPFAGRFNSISLCCNGIMFTNASEYESVAKGTFMMDFDNMVPNPQIGTGLFAWWNLSPEVKILGGAKPIGQCMTIYTMCSVSTPTDWSVMQMGTSLLP